VVAQGDDEGSPLRADELPEGVPDFDERGVVEYAVELIDGTQGVEVGGVRLGEEIDQVAIDHQSLSVLSLQTQEVVDESSELIPLLEDLAAGRLPPEVEVGDDVQAGKYVQQAHGRVNRRPNRAHEGSGLFARAVWEDLTTSVAP
jgi:hypothetical protein